MEIRDRLDQLVDSDELTPGECEALWDELLRDPETTSLLTDWIRVRAHLRETISGSVQDRRLFVLCALAYAGHSSELSEKERAEVESALPQFERTIQTHAGLAEAARSVELDRADFLVSWDEAARPVRRLMPRIWRIAAVFAVVGLLGALALILQQRGADWRMMTAAEGSSVRFELPDGSVMHLVGPAEARYPGAYARQLNLTGSAFFDVVAAAEDFTVTTSEAVTTVLGTRFGVVAMGGFTEVVVESGRVALEPEGASEQRVVLQPGEMSRVSAGEAPTEPESTEIALALGWTGFMFFRATPLGEAASMLAERYGVSIIVHPDLVNEPVTGSFGPEESISLILNALATTLDAVAVEDDSAWQITP